MIDYDKIKEAVLLFLDGIGEDVNREGLIDTPDRVARMCNEIFGGNDGNVEKHLQKQFECKSQNMVIEKDITFFSTCEHHILPFFGKVHIAYIPNGRVVGLSKLARTVDEYSRRLQLQENLTYEIAAAVDKSLNSNGVMVMIEAEHTCMTMRGIKKPGSKTVTTATTGQFCSDRELRKEFFDALRIKD